MTSLNFQKKTYFTQTYIHKVHQSISFDGYKIKNPVPGPSISVDYLSNQITLNQFGNYQNLFRTVEIQIHGKTNKNGI